MRAMVGEGRRSLLHEVGPGMVGDRGFDGTGEVSGGEVEGRAGAADGVAHDGVRAGAGMDARRTARDVVAVDPAAGVVEKDAGGVVDKGVADGEGRAVEHKAVGAALADDASL